MSELRDRSIVRKQYLVDLSKYDVIKKLKPGGFGTVFLIRDKKTKEDFAAKILKLEDETSKKMINREISIMILLHHQTFIKFLGYSLNDFEGNDNVAIIMDFATKGSLESLLKEVRRGLGSLNYDNTVRQKILIGIARGMMYLHQHRIIHRDLKPDNVLLDDQYQPHIADFGLSKIYEKGRSQKQSQCSGTSIYMAPEVINGMPYNGKADVYSFAILMFEVLTDTEPYPDFQAGKMCPFQFNKKVIEENYRPIFTVPVKESLKKLIIQCWSENPQERPTFEDIFNKLAFNMEEFVCDVFASDDEYKFYLDNVNVDDVLDYAFDVSESDKIGKEEMRELKEMNKSLLTQLNNHEKMIDSLNTENKNLIKKLNEHEETIESLRADNNELNLKLIEHEQMINRLRDDNKKQKTKPNDHEETPENSRADNKKPKTKPNDHEETNETFITDNKKQKTKPNDHEETTKNSRADTKKPKDPKVISQKTTKDGDADLRKSPSSSPSKIREFTCSRNHKLNGIMNYLYKTTGGNIHTNGTIEISSSSFDNKYTTAANLGDLETGLFFSSKNEANSFVLFDFKDMSIQLSSYTIVSRNTMYKLHPRNWEIRVSNDKENWITVDSRCNNPKLNGTLKTVYFEVQNESEDFYRFIQIISNGYNWSNDINMNVLSSSKIDFFGKLKYP